MDLVVAVYALAKKLPNTERYELSRQIRRAAVSSPSNVAEGQGNGPGKRYRAHVRLALGSLAELETQLEVAVRLGFLRDQDLATLKEQLARMGQLLLRLRRSLPGQIGRH